MLQILNNAQLIELERVLKEQLLAKSIIDVDSEPTENLLNKNSNNELIEKFIAAKCVEGCSKATLRYLCKFHKMRHVNSQLRYQVMRS